MQSSDGCWRPVRAASTKDGIDRAGTAYEVFAVDVHCGSPARVVVGGLEPLDPPGASAFEKMRYLSESCDWLRRLLVFEPRGRASQSVDLVLPPSDCHSQFAMVVMELAKYYPAMSGGNTICTVTALLETGWLAMDEPQTTLRVETPAGRVDVTADCAGGRIRKVTFRNVPAFVTHLDVPIELEGVGHTECRRRVRRHVLRDGGRGRRRPDLDVDAGAALARVGEQLRAATPEQVKVVHRENPDIDQIESTLWYGPPGNAVNDGRNAVVFTTAAFDAGRPETWKACVDRSPCGTGTSALLAVLSGKGRLDERQDIRDESITDLVFTGHIESRTRVGDLPAVVPVIAGRPGLWGMARICYATMTRSLMASRSPTPGVRVRMAHDELGVGHGKYIRA